MTPSQKLELDHLLMLSKSHPNWREYAEAKARDLAHRMPKRWGWLPAELSTALKGKKHDGRDRDAPSSSPEPGSD